jgi:signal transduction histidine kinase
MQANGTLSPIPDLISVASHELRAPLTAILGFAQLLDQRWTRLSDEERQRYVAAIIKAANRQRRLVDDLIIVGQCGSGDVPVNVEAVRCAPLIEQAIEEVRASDPFQSIVADGPPELTVRADTGRAIQVLFNLIDNAAKYSPEGSTVKVSWEHEGAMAAITVRDEGTGVPLEDREHLFTRYGRLQGSAIRAGRGALGIGLYVSRGLARAMSGDLVLESSGPTGSIFKLLLMAAQA